MASETDGLTAYTPRERAVWALLGDDQARVPETLQDLVKRVEHAIRQAIYYDRKQREEAERDRHIADAQGGLGAG